MLYIFPIRFFNHCEIPEEELANLTILKKRVQAEFALEPTGIITVDDFHYNKQDILQEIEQHNFLQRWEFHKKIWQSSSLLQLIEKEKIDFATFSSLQSLNLEANFVQFLSPFMVSPFGKIMKILLNNGNFKDGITWLEMQKFMVKEDLFDAFQSFTFFCEKTFFLFRNISRENYTNKLESIDIWTNKNQNWALFFNSLPEFLIEYREEISHGLTHLVVELQFPNIKRSYAISKMLINLQVSPAQEELIKKNNEIIKKHYKQENKPAIFSSKYARFSYFGLFILIRIIYFFYQDSNKDRPAVYDSYKTIVPISPKVDSILNNPHTPSDSTNSLMLEKRNH